MKKFGVFFFLSNLFPFKENKVYFCIYVNTDYILNDRFEKGKIFLTYFEDTKDYPVGVISHKQFNDFLKNIKEQFDCEIYKPEQLNAIMEKKGIYKKGMKKYSTKWFQNKYEFIENQLK